MNKIISRLTAFGVPGLVYFVAATNSGLLGGASLVGLLAILGGPIGVIGAVVLASTTAAIKGVVKLNGFEPTFDALVEAYEAKGMTRDEIRDKVSRYPISTLLKAAVLEQLGRRA